jgi:hypothetical protein
MFAPLFRAKGNPIVYVILASGLSMDQAATDEGVQKLVVKQARVPGEKGWEWPRRRNNPSMFFDHKMYGRTRKLHDHCHDYPEIIMSHPENR